MSDASRDPVTVPRRSGRFLACALGLVWATGPQPGAFPVEIGPEVVDDRGASCGRTGGNRSMSKFGPGNPCGLGLRPRRTSPTHSLRGKRDRSETKIRTHRSRLAGGVRGGRVTGPPESEEPAGSTGSVTSTGRAVTAGPRPRAEAQRITNRRALVAHTCKGPSTISGPRTGADAPETRRLIQSHRPDPAGNAGWRMHVRTMNVEPERRGERMPDGSEATDETRRPARGVRRPAARGGRGAGGGELGPVRPPVAVPVQPRRLRQLRVPRSRASPTSTR